MPQHLQAIIVFGGDDRHMRVLLDQIGRVDDLIIDLAGQCGFCQTGADGFSDLIDRDRVVEVFLVAVGQSDYGHIILFSVVTGTRGHMGVLVRAFIASILSYWILIGRSLADLSPGLFRLWRNARAPLRGLLCKS